MKHVGLVLVLLIALWRTSSLSSRELEAISSLSEEWPVLRSLVPSWTLNASEACNDPPFYGLTCSGGPDPHVVSLVLENTPLASSIPNAIAGFGWMEQLKLFESQLNGTIPREIWGMTNLKFLSLVGTSNLAGSISQNIDQLVNLESLELISPWFNGTIPVGIGSCKKLRFIHLSSSPSEDQVDPSIADFRGEIPKELCSLDLQAVSLSQTNFYGVSGTCEGHWPNLEFLDISFMPAEMGYFPALTKGRSKLKFLDISATEIRSILDFSELPSLETIRASRSPIDGHLDDTLWSLENLTEVVFADTRMDGSISPSIGLATKLEKLDLSFQKLFGTIPPEIGLCKSLRHIRLTNTALSGLMPPELSDLSNLQYLALSGSQIQGILPKSFSKLTRISSISIAGCQILSDIPDSWANLTSLVQLDLSLNRLFGTIPNFPANLKRINLSNNLLTGSIPPQILATANRVDLSQNHLSGTIPSTITENPWLESLGLSSNELTGELPTFSRAMEQPSGPQVRLSLSNNDFSGYVPYQYGRMFFRALKLANNRLNGTFSLLSHPDNNIQLLDISNNQFEGTMPTKFASRILEVLFMSNNRFEGTIPRMPSSLVAFKASHNQLKGDISRFFGSGHRNMRILDLSHNKFEGPLPDFSETQLSHLSLAHNAYSGPIYSFPTVGSPPVVANLQELDLSDNHLTGVFPTYPFLFKELTTLKISGNHFFGYLNFESMPSLTVLDIANNSFSFDAAEFDSRSGFVSLNLRNNQIYGSLALHGMSSLRTADFTNNSLNFPIELRSIGMLFSKYELELLSISQNPFLPKISDLDSKSAILGRTKTTTPSFHPGVKCFQLAFSGSVEGVFSYDEALFDYDQCECDDTHFGAPPLNCFECPASGSSPSNCSGPHLSVDPNFFAYQALDGEEQSSKVMIGVESCFSDDYQLGTSNCLGLSIAWDKSVPTVASYQTGTSYPSDQNISLVPSRTQLQHQCRVGSSGRRCWRCDCEASGPCFYPGPGNLCVSCSTVFRPSTYIPVALILIILAIVVLAIVFYFVLRSKRSSKDEKWESLSIFKRLVYRVIHLTSVGHITVLVTFVQLLVELTHWDAYAIRTWLRLVNGEGDGLGLRCFFPFLAHPMSLLLFKLFLPFLAAAFVATSIGLAELLHRFSNAWQMRKAASMSVSEDSSDIQSEGRDESSISLLERSPEAEQIESGRVHYPAKALISSTSISIFRFFYFGAALSSLDYIFPESQEITKKKFVQAVPWMAFDDARALRGVSIPFIVLFLMIVPASFVALAWKLRHKILSPFVRLHFGSLFENFQSRAYWWELVMIYKKMSIALVLRSMPASNGFQICLIISILGSLLIATSSSKPWKQHIINVLYSISSLLLILSLVISRISGVAHFKAVFTFILVLDGIFVALCIVFIAIETVTGLTDYQKQWNLRFAVNGSPAVSTGSYGPPLLNELSTVHQQEYATANRAMNPRETSTEVSEDEM
jgi:Leucine-rich repeat (LRR) protein